MYKSLKGWNVSTFGLKKWSDLPKQAQIYISTIEELIETKVSIISKNPNVNIELHEKNENLIKMMFKAF